jgi:hypothetical protein
MSETIEIEEEQFRKLLQQVDAEASNHGGDYSAGMRHARHLVESGVLSGGDDDDTE